MTNLKPVRLTLLAAGLALTTATAQTATDTSTAADTNATHMSDRRGFDWGWLGLLGLAGLLGLRRPDRLTETRSGTGSNRV